MYATIDAASADFGISLVYDGYQPTVSYTNGGLYFARRIESGWQSELVDGSDEDLKTWTSLAYDNIGNPSIVYRAGSPTEWAMTIRFARYNGSSWEFETIGSGGAPSLAYDADPSSTSFGTAFVSYDEWFRDMTGVLYFAQWNRISWETETVDWVFPGRGSSIALDSAGNPTISYADWDNQNLKFAWRDPSSNAPPTVNITSPEDGSTFPSGDTIVFAGTANDPEDGVLTAYLTWTSDIDGPISSPATLSVGPHIITASVTDSGGKTGSDSVSITVGEPITPTIYVEDIEMDWGKAGINYYALATVWIIDDDITNVEGATVYGDWSGAVSGTASGSTGADGKVILQSPKKKNGGTFTFTVTNVVASGYIYDEGLNVETEGSITVP